MPTALITGASRGIGRRTAELLAHQGWDLLLTARSADQLEQLAAQLSSTGVSVATAAIDLTQPEGIAAAMAGLLQQGETPSVLINNAGAAYTGDLLACLLYTSPSPRDRTRSRMPSSA